MFVIFIIEGFMNFIFEGPYMGVTISPIFPSEDTTGCSLNKVRNEVGPSKSLIFFILFLMFWAFLDNLI